MHPFAIGISGGSCSGKTSLTEALVKYYDTNAVSVSEDWYYRDISQLPAHERVKINFDDPGALESNLLAAHLDALMSGKAVEVPQYDFVAHTRSPQTLRILPGNILVVEGLHVIGFNELDRLLGLRVFVDAPESVRRARRIERDVRERGRTPEQAAIQFNDTVQPMHKRHVEPLRSKADIILSGEEPLPQLLAKLTGHIDSRQG